MKAFALAISLILAGLITTGSLFAQPIPVDCDGDVFSQLANTNDVKTFSFISNGEECVTIRMQTSKGTTMVCRIELYAPDGQQIASAQAPSFVDNSATIFPLKLGLPGQYLVKAMNAEPIFFSDGEFGLSVQILRPSCALPMECATAGEGIFEKSAQTDAYWFVAQPGDHFILRLQALPLLNAKMTVYTIGGDSIAEGTTPAGGNVRVDLDFSALAEADTVFLLFRDEENFFLGDYAFAYQRLRPSCAQVLACDADTTGELYYMEMDAYCLPVLPGDRMLLRAKGSQLRLEFFHRDGTAWLPPAADAEDLIQVKYTFTETDTLIVVAMRSFTNFIYYYTSQDLSIQLIRPDCAIPLVCNVPTGGSFIYEPQVEAFRFDIGGGEKVLLRAGSTSHHWGRMEIYSPNSFPTPFWVMEETNISAQLRFEMQLDTPGTWYVLLMERDWIDMDLDGSYGLSFHRLDNMDCGQPISYNTNLTATIEFPGTMDAFVLHGNAGDVLTTQSGNCIDGYEAALELYDSLGNKIASDYTQIFVGGVARLDTFHLPATGRYKLLAFENYGNLTGQYGLSLQKVNPGQNAPSLQPGQTVSDSFAYPTDTHVHTFHADQGGGFTLKAHSQNDDLDVYAQVYDPAGHLVGHTVAASNGTIIKSQLPVSGTYTVLTSGWSDCPAGSYDLTLTTTVGTEDVALSKALAASVYPNPFSENVTFEFELSSAGDVKAEILNATGEVVAVLKNENMGAGRHLFQWNGAGQPAGCYMLRMQAGSGSYFQKLILIQ